MNPVRRSWAVPSNYCGTGTFENHLLVFRTRRSRLGVMRGGDCEPGGPAAIARGGPTRSDIESSCSEQASEPLSPCLAASHRLPSNKPIVRILFDGYWWVDGPPSGRNVLRALVAGWSRAFPGDALTLRVPKCQVSDVADDLRRTHLDIDLDSYPACAKYHAAAVATIMARSNRYDAVLTQNFCPPLSTTARVTLLHDALFVSNPEWFTRPELLYLGAIRPSLRRATTVLTTSDAETVRIGAMWPELRSRLATVGLSVPDDLVEAQPQRPAGLPDAQRFVLAVGRLNVRKNLARLIEAFISIAHDDPERHLVIVGRKDGVYAPAEVPDEMQARIHFLGHVTDDELRWLYENCGLFVSPSLGEGYGLPLIEANMFGAQVIASDIPVFRELAIATAYFDPMSVDEMAAAIRGGLGSAATPSASRLTWDEVVQNIRDAIEKGAR